VTGLAISKLAVPSRRQVVRLHARRDDRQRPLRKRERHKAEGRELAPGEAVSNVVLEFRPRPTQDMQVACLSSRWTAPGEHDLLSFAAITDEPPPEVAAAGHDRCIIPIQPAHIDAWLNPDPADMAAQYAVLDDRARPYYEHRLAA
jgi:putative SOS response-associated peptidase YedK